MPLLCKDTLAANHDTDKAITYMGVFVDGNELETVGEWVASGALKNVRQIGMRLHTGKKHLKLAHRPKVLRRLLTNFYYMHGQGFRLVSVAPNLCIGKMGDAVDKKHYTYTDVLFVKPQQYDTKSKMEHTEL